MKILDGTITAMDCMSQKAEQDFLKLLNDYRQANHLEPVRLLASLQMAATWMARDLGKFAYFDHNDHINRDPWARMAWCGYDQNAWKGENIAAGYLSGAQVFEGWRTSPGHNANMLGSHYRYCGLALVITPGSPFGYYWVNDFASVWDPTWTGLDKEPAAVAAATIAPMGILALGGEATKVPTVLPPAPANGYTSSMHVHPR